MKRILFITALCLLLITPYVFADRNTSTTVGYSADTLIKRGDWKVYRISFIATSNSGSFAIYDSLEAGSTTDSNIKTEGSEATAANGKPMDFTAKPLEGSTGIFLVIKGGTATVEYE